MKLKETKMILNKKKEIIKKKSDKNKNFDNSKYIYSKESRTSDTKNSSRILKLNAKK